MLLRKLDVNRSNGHRQLLGSLQWRPKYIVNGCGRLIELNDMFFAIQRPQHPDGAAGFIKHVAAHARIIAERADITGASQHRNARLEGLVGFVRLHRTIHQPGGAPASQAVPDVGREVFGDRAHVRLSQEIGFGRAELIFQALRLAAIPPTEQGGLGVQEIFPLHTIQIEHAAQVVRLGDQRRASGIPGTVPVGVRVLA